MDNVIINWWQYIKVLPNEQNAQTDVDNLELN